VNLRRIIPFLDPSIEQWATEARFLHWLTFIWLFMGLTVLYSVSFHVGLVEYGDGLYYFKRQLLGVLLGLIGFTVAVRMPLKRFLTIAPVLFFVVLGLIFLNQRGMFDRSRGNALAQDVIASHVRSLLATHLLDVPSTDQHTVKPWFDGKLKFAPPVRDFADQGFRLIGGRLDYINGREVAALVYQRRLHIINLFIWPLESGLNTASESFTKDGYNVSHWERDGFAFWAVSDVNADDLRAFAGLEMQQS